MEWKKSIEAYQRAIKLIPGGAQVISKVYGQPGRVPYGCAPAFMTGGKGSRVWDIDGNEYVDWSASLGPVTLGYDFFSCFPTFSSLPMSHIMEIELAEKLTGIIPCAEMVRFFKNGSDATSAAVRLCRYITGKRKVITCEGYHGCQDWSASVLPYPKNGGCIDEWVRRIPYGDIRDLENELMIDRTACIIMEPMTRLCPEKASAKYLQQVRDICDKYGIPLIFDEIIMGFRYALAGGQEYFGVTPDLATYSKGMANGAAISALVGRRSLMVDLENLQLGGTFSGDLFGLYMANRTFDFYRDNRVVEKLTCIGDKLSGKIRAIISLLGLKDQVRLKGFGPWSAFVWNDSLVESIFLTEVFKGGVFYNRDHFAMYSHTKQDVEKTERVYLDAFGEVAKFLERTKND